MRMDNGTSIWIWLVLWIRNCSDGDAMNANLRLIKNTRIVAKLSKWPSKLPAPIHVSDTRAKEIAVSALCNLSTRDGERIHSSDLTNEQAADVARWATNKKEN